MKLTDLNVNECSFDELLKLETILKKKINKSKDIQLKKTLQVELCYIQNEIELRTRMRRKNKR
jgi:hypothetical protein